MKSGFTNGDMTAPTAAVRLAVPALKPHWQTAHSGWSIDAWSRTRTSPARIFGCTC